MKRVVTIGGGSGSYQILRSLKELDFDITAVVNMFDSGGSSGVLRDEFGLLPPGDVRRALLALSDESQSEILREIFNFRFEGGSGLNGHNFGNLFLVALSSIYGGDAEAIEKTSELLHIKGNVLPVSLDKAHVHAVLENGEVIIGETNIDIPKHDANLRIKELYLEPQPEIYEPAARAVRSADVIVICPGDLYSSLIPALLTRGMSAALSATHGTIVWVCNIMTKHGETDNYAVDDFARELLRYADMSAFGVALVNTCPIAEEIRDEYARNAQFPVQFDAVQMAPYARALLTGDFLSEGGVVRHDSLKLARAIAGL